LTALHRHDAAAAAALSAATPSLSPLSQQSRITAGQAARQFAISTVNELICRRLVIAP